jgi:cell shape-determining protein MreC
LLKHLAELKQMLQHLAELKQMLKHLAEHLAVAKTFSADLSPRVLKRFSRTVISTKRVWMNR